MKSVVARMMGVVDRFVVYIHEKLIFRLTHLTQAYSHMRQEMKFCDTTSKILMLVLKGAMDKDSRYEVQPMKTGYAYTQ